jgi:hypothetical protein
MAKEGFWPEMALFSVKKSNAGFRLPLEITLDLNGGWRIFVICDDDGC